MDDQVTYVLPQPLLQAIVGTLSELPARVSRALLNAIEAECLRQDRERSEARPDHA